MRQSFFYSRTPGHNPLLVGHWLRKSEQQGAALLDEDAFQSNLDFSDPSPKTFYVRSGSGNANLWNITEETPESYEGSFRGNTPAPWTSPYWVVECGEELIADHGDVWSPEAMEVYAGLYRLAAKNKGL